MENRKRSLPLGKRGWAYKYPKTFQLTFTVLGLGIFFSKPIYDIFFRPRDDFVDVTEPPTTRPYHAAVQVENGNGIRG